jgi:hypothetical protein
VRAQSHTQAESFHGMEEVVGSIPTRSTNLLRPPPDACRLLGIGQSTFSSLTWQTGRAKLHPKLVGFHSRHSASRFF